MAFWNIDLETRMGAESAADQGSLACFIYAGFLVLGAVFVGAFSAPIVSDSTTGIILLAPILIQVVVMLVAGFRLRAGKGAFWGLGAAILMGLGVLGQLANLSIGVGLVITGLLFVFMIQGVRGAFALRKSEFGEDDIEAFE